MYRPLLIFFVCLATIIKGATQKSPAYEIYALKYAILQNPTAVSVWASNAPEKDSVRIIFMFWLIKDKEGKNILVDAGCSNDMQEAIEFGLYKFTRPDSLLTQVGLKSTD